MAFPQHDLLKKSFVNYPLTIEGTNGGNAGREPVCFHTKDMQYSGLITMPTIPKD